MQSEMSVLINRPIHEVFDYTIHNVGEWSTIVVSDEILNDRPLGLGSRFRVTTEERGRQMVFDGEVTRHEAPTAHSVIMKGPAFDIEADYRFEDLGGQTRVTQASRVHARGFLKIIMTLLGPLTRKSSQQALEKELLNLKRLAEARA